MIKRKLENQIYLSTHLLRPNIQKLLESFNMIVIGEVQDFTEGTADEDIDEYGIEEGDPYGLCEIKEIDHLGYFKDGDFCIITFPSTYVHSSS